jgi:hypothetical protein
MRQFFSMIDNRDNSQPAEKPDGLELILTTQNQIYLEMIKEALEGEGIPALVKSVAGYYTRGMLPFPQGFFDYRLFVSKEDEKRAREIVETIIPPEEIR